MNKLLLTLLIFLVAIPIALAGNIETNNFFERSTNAPLTGVEMVGFTCTDNNEQCVTVAQPPFFQGNSGNTNSITLEYPGTPTPTDYGVYFYAQGFIPVEGLIPDDFGTGLTFNYNLFFEQVPVCRAPIEAFVVANTVFQNEPLQIDLRAALDALTISAFRDAGTPPFFVPDAFKDEYYSARTDVTLTILDPLNNLVHTETRNLNIFMDTAELVQFTWTPTLPGTGYTAEITTRVPDNQCASDEAVTVSQTFTVLEDRPQNECYAIVNTLFVDNPFPIVNQPITVFYQKVSNFADANSDLTPIPMEATYTVRDATNQIVFTQTVTEPTSDMFFPELASFTFTPTTTGFHTIEVNARGSSNLCTTVPNIETTNELEVFVQPAPTSDIIFTITDLSNNPIIGATVTITSTATTDSTGKATLTDLQPGTYTYTITHTNFKTLTGTVEVGLTDVFVHAQLSSANRPPQIFLEPLTLTVGTSTTLDFTQFVSDPDDAKSTLILTAAGNSAVQISINGLQVTFTAPSTATIEDITFTVTDPSGATASDTMTVTVSTTNGAPTISNLPDITIAEGTYLMDAFNLRDFVSDVETPIELLTFSLTPNFCGARVDINANVDIAPLDPDFNGQCTITATVRDQSGLTASDDFTVTVTPVNDAPVIDSFNPPLKAFIGQLYTYAVQAFDPDFDPLTFSLITAPIGMVIDPVTGVITWTPVVGQEGLNTIIVTVTDGTASDSQTFQIDVNGINNPPVITSTPVLTAQTGELYRYDVDAFDPDVGDIITFRLDTAPQGMSLDGETGLITFTPTLPGTFQVEITARDQFGGSDTQSYELTVTGNRINLRGIDRKGVIFSKIRIPSSERLEPGQSLDLSIQLTNNFEVDLEDIKITAFVYEWGSRRSVGPFDLDEGEQFTASLHIDIPEGALSGDYDLRIAASNDDITHLTHRIVTIE